MSLFLHVLSTYAGVMVISDAKYVALTTVRRSGDVVPTPVWIAPLSDGRVGFSTGEKSGKVKRLRNNSAVTLQQCTMRGKVVDGSPIVTGTAVVVSGPEYQAVHAAIRAKYGFMVTLIGIGDRVKKLFGKGETPTAIVITLADPS